MSKKILLPKLALMGIRKNSPTYIPYIAACIFSVFAYFVFDSILYNDLMEKLPRAGYAWMLMRFGFILLGIILVPFLFYTNSFLIKRRGKELGLYSILGLEKKHIGIMMALETIYIYVLVLLAGTLTGIVFSKLIFLLLLNLAGLPIDASFTFQPAAVAESAAFWGFVSLLNLAVNLFQVGRTNPTELMRKARKGEKESKSLSLLAVLGAAALSVGYYLSITTQLDGFIFHRFILAILLVVAGTYFLFTWGSIVILRILRANKRFYYKKENFITLSGMYSRMKKSATSLVNICIFATMIMITLLCTVSLYAGTAGMLRMAYPYTLQLRFQNQEGARQTIDTLTALAVSRQVTVDTLFSYRRLEVELAQEEQHFSVHSDKKYAYEGWYQIYFIPLEDFNAIGRTEYLLEPDEILLYSTGPDYGYDTITIENKQYRIKAELSDAPMSKKTQNNSNIFSQHYYIILPNEAALQESTAWWETNDTIIYNICIELDGSKEAIEEVIQAAYESAAGQEGFLGIENGYAGRMELRSMNGGLLFIGIFFGIIFMMCMILVMYYKQITEGFDDKNNFDIMQQVGMSDREVRATIEKQIFMVFFVPLAGAIFHTAAGLPMIIKLMAAIQLFDVHLMLICGAGVIFVFCLIYMISYLVTARAYYEIVRKMA